MSVWEQKIFSELGVCIRGVSYKPEDLRPDFSEKSIALLRSNNIKNGRLWFHDLQFVDQAVVRDNQKLQNHDIAICMSNGNRALVGKSGQFIGDGDNVEYTVGAFCSIFRPATGFNATYIRYLFGSGDYQRQLDGILAGSAINNLRASDIHGLTADCPISVPEQNQIAAILSALDKAIEQTEALIAKQQRIKTGLMQDLLTKGIDENGNIRSEATHEFKDSPLGRIPVEWEVKHLGSVSEHLTSGSRGWARYYSNEGAIFLRIGNLTREHINLRLDDLVFVQVPDSSEGKRTALIKDDLLISITADLGIVGVIPKQFQEAYVNQHIALVRLNYEMVYPRFVGHLLGGAIGRGQIEKLNESGAKAGLNLPTVERLLIVKPKKREQEQIADMLDSADKQIAHEKLRLKKLIRLKAGLMHDLLTAKVRVTELLASHTSHG